MKIYVVSTLPIKQYVLDSNISGIAITIYISNLLTSNGYNQTFIEEQLKPEIIKIGNSGKKCSLGIIWGSHCTNTIWSNYPYVEMVRKHHSGQGNPVSIKLPCFYDNDYIDKFALTNYWLYDGLKQDSDIWDIIEGIKCAPANESSLEMRATSQSWKTATTQASAYNEAAKEWQRMGYTYEKALTSCCDMIDIFSNNYPDKTSIMPYIAGLNGFPAINMKDEICAPAKRPQLTQTILNYNAEVKPQSTIFSATTIAAPNSYYQINNQLYGNPKPPYPDTEFKKMLANAEAQQVEQLEVFPLNILFYPQIFNT